MTATNSSEQGGEGKRGPSAPVIMLCVCAAVFIFLSSQFSGEVSLWFVGVAIWLMLTAIVIK